LEYIFFEVDEFLKYSQNCNTVFKVLATHINVILTVKELDLNIIHPNRDFLRMEISISFWCNLNYLNSDYNLL